jgi:hypothetical protein
MSVAMLIATFHSILFALPSRTPLQFEISAQNNHVWNVVLVEFQEDNSLVTTGNGTFLQNRDEDAPYIFDPPPHNKQYFQSHLISLGNYWHNVSDGRIRIDTSLANILPANNLSVTLSREMRYYHPANKPDSIDYKLAELVYETLSILKNEHGVNSLSKDVILFHAGVGQDFDFSDMYDPTPYDIPSFYFDRPFLEKYLRPDHVVLFNDLGVERGIVLPEMQNQLDFNVALNGTVVLMSGFLLGLPPLYNTETGRSGTGIFGLMDQGSNNGNGLLPIRLSAFEREILGLATPRSVQTSGTVSLSPGETVKIPISSREYFLIEYRRNTGFRLDSLYQMNSLDTIPENKRYKTYLDALKFLKEKGVNDYYVNPITGVLESVENYDVSLPGSGILIWHINNPDKALFEYPENPNGQAIPMVRLEEADGSYDIGKNYGFLSGHVNQGWKWDMWFTKNPGFIDNNKHLFNMTDIEFSDRTNPNTRSFAGVQTGIRLRNFTFSSEEATFSLNFGTESHINFPGFTALGSSQLGLYDKSVVFGIKDGAFVSLQDTVFTNLLDLSSIAITPQNLAIFPNKDYLTLVYSNNTQHFIRLYQPDPQNKSFSFLREKTIPHPVQLSKISLVKNELLLPDADQTNPGYSIFDFSNSELQPRHSTISSRIRGARYKNNLIIANEEYLFHPQKSVVQKLPFTIGTLASYGDTLILSNEDVGGYHYYDFDMDTLYNRIPILIQQNILQIIPLNLSKTKGPDLLILCEDEFSKKLYLTDSDGSPWPGFPVTCSYETIRAYFNGDSLQIVGVTSVGKSEILNDQGERLATYFLSPEPKTLFMAKYDTKIHLVSEGDFISLSGDSVHWGYEAGDIFGSRFIQTDQTFFSEYPAAFLIADNRIYNYPNPVSEEATRFRYFAVSAEKIDIAIYDLKGKFVEQLSQIPIQNQWNEVVWDVRNRHSGVYIAKITVSGSGKSETFIIKPAILK